VKLLEYEAKRVMREYGIPVPQGDVATEVSDAEALARDIGKPVALKAQIAVSGRGKAGGIQFADGSDRVREVARSLLGSTIKESLVNSLLVEEQLDITDQYYLSLAVDGSAKSYVVLVSTEGGVDIEQIARESPDKIKRYWTEPISGFTQAEAREMLSGFSLDDRTTDHLAQILVILYSVAMDKDASLVELNPLVRISSGEFIAADARIIVDDNALFRHPEFEGHSLVEEATPREIEARKQGLAYVDLGGDTGVVTNGAGLAMATVDMVNYFGGSPSNFLDIGGGGNVEITKKGMLLVLSKPEVKGVVVNIFGGITRCDLVAQAVVEAVSEASVRKPVAVSLMGTNQDEGQRILSEAGITSYPGMEEAVVGILKMQRENEHHR
jgi:succinyl-CoA synthetase beta subunit